jgi:DNA repair protein RadC
MKLKNLPVEERPRERLLKFGSENLSNEELLSIILKTGTKKFSVKEVANNLLSEIKNINNLKECSINNLTKSEINIPQKRPYPKSLMPSGFSLLFFIIFTFTQIYK